jgi:hypothetical protein
MTVMLSAITIILAPAIIVLQVLMTRRRNRDMVEIQNLLLARTRLLEEMQLRDAVPEKRLGSVGRTVYEQLLAEWFSLGWTESTPPAMTVPAIPRRPGPLESDKPIVATLRVPTLRRSLHRRHRTLASATLSRWVAHVDVAARPVIPRALQALYDLEIGERAQPFHVTYYGTFRAPRGESSR